MASGEVAGIILAAGESRRWGSPKQLLPLGGKPLLAWALDAALASKLAKVVLVLGREREAVLAALGDRAGDSRLEVVCNPNFTAGQGGSLAVGLAALGDRFAAALFLLGDQPLVTPALIDALLRRFAASDRGICLPVCGGRRGNPVLFARPFFPALLALEGDAGGRGIIAAHPEAVLTVPIDDAAAFWDIDRPEDLARLQRRLAAGRRG